jgi:hypothetical protein
VTRLGLWAILVFTSSSPAFADVSVKALKARLIAGEPLYLVATSDTKISEDVWQSITIQAEGGPRKPCRNEFDRGDGVLSPAQFQRSIAVLASAVCGSSFVLKTPGRYYLDIGRSVIDIYVLPTPEGELAPLQSFRWEGGHFSAVSGSREFIRRFPESIFSGYLALGTSHPSADTNSILPPARALELWKHIEVQGASREAALRYLKKINDECSEDTQFWNQFLSRYPEFPLAGLARLRTSSCPVYSRECAKARAAASQVSEPWYSATKGWFLSELAKVETSKLCRSESKE